MVNEAEERVTWKGWVALFILILMFSGLFENAEGPIRALDLSNLIGQFGTIGEGGNFRGAGGTGARDGFLFTLTLIPTTCLAVGLIDLVEHLGGLKAAAKLFNPILRPLLGIPGISGLAFVSSFTSSDIAAFMTKQLVDNGHMTDDERTVFVAYQYAGSAVILNTIGTQAALLPIVLLPVGPLIVILWICKIFGANLVRLIIKSRNKKAGVAA
ncbi:MAG: nucleoside recognition domain-containing protein [bacterium]|jgi:nucleoside recognition membrane protein YjiH